MGLRLPDFDLVTALVRLLLDIGDGKYDREIMHALFWHASPRLQALIYSSARVESASLASDLIKVLNGDDPDLQTMEMILRWNVPTVERSGTRYPEIQVCSDDFSYYHAPDNTLHCQYRHGKSGLGLGFSWYYAADFEAECSAHFDYTEMAVANAEYGMKYHPLRWYDEWKLEYIFVYRDDGCTGYGSSSWLGHPTLELAIHHFELENGLKKEGDADDCASDPVLVSRTPADEDDNDDLASAISPQSVTFSDDLNRSPLPESTPACSPPVCSPPVCSLPKADAPSPPVAVKGPGDEEDWHDLTAHDDDADGAAEPDAKEVLEDDLTPFLV